jgi:S1-C subfamily serine protease
VVPGTVENGRGWSCSVELDGGLCRKPQYGLIVQAAGARGYSGGPVVDRHGRLVGITQGIFATAYAADGTVLRGGPRMFAYSIADALAEVEALQSGQEVADLMLVRSDDG